MTDAMLFAIIGVSGTIVGTGIGALIGALTTYLSTKAQINAKTNELRLQFEHERKEKQIARLVEIRAAYLNPIREQLQSITKSTHYLETRLSDLTFLTGDDDTIAWADSRSNEYLIAMDEPIKSISKAIDNIEMLRTQNTDSQLFTLIMNTLTDANNLSKQNYKLRDLRNKHGEGEGSDKPNREISTLCISALQMITELFGKIRQTNRRIEEILSGLE